MSAEQHWKPMSPAKTLSSNKRSLKALFSLKFRSSIVEFGTDAGIIQFQFDRCVLRTLSAKTAIAASKTFDMSLTTADQPWSPLYWRDHHRALIDVVQQLGYPQLFLTVSPNEWLFHRQKQKKNLRTCGRPPNGVPGFETLPVAHALHEMCSKYLCGRGHGKCWRHFHLCNKRRFEFQDGVG